MLGLRVYNVVTYKGSGADGNDCKVDAHEPEGLLALVVMGVGRTFQWGPSLGLGWRGLGCIAGAKKRVRGG
jgi:hypothetical protein